MPHRANPSEEQALPAVFQAATPSADFNYSHPAIAIHSRPVTSRVLPQSSHYASGYPRFLKAKKHKKLPQVMYFVNPLANLLFSYFVSYKD
jgi:hypothetical protein